jgi:exosortase
VLIAVVALFYWPTTSALWHRPVFGGNALLVAALALWLLVRLRDRVASAPAAGVPWALLLLVPCSIGALVFWRSGIPALQLLLLPALILLAVWTALGSAVTRLIAVPVCFLYFAVPAWDLLGPPLQSLTLWAVSWLAPAFGVPATVSGTMVLVPGNISFEVSLACSGSGFVLEGLAVAVLLGELGQATIGRRVGLMVTMVIIALVANWVRVLALVQIGYSTGMRHVLVTEHHVLFGYVLFIAVLIVFVWIAVSVGPTRTPHVAQSALYSSGARTAFVPALLGLAAAPVLVALLVLFGHEGSVVSAHHNVQPTTSGYFLQKSLSHLAMNSSVGVPEPARELA